MAFDPSRADPADLVVELKGLGSGDDRSRGAHKHQMDDSITAAPAFPDPAHSVRPLDFT
jgi:hypothetical protein